MKPLENVIVLEFCQFLAGPSAGLRLADLGARVIKIERPGTGDNGRKLAVKDLYEGEDSLLFHTINRNKGSYTADLKSEKDLNKIKKLLTKVDILTHNFRPGVMEKLGLGYDTIRKINPQIIYAAITGYGDKGPWKNKPGQDLLIQALSGLTWLSGNRKDPPISFGLSIADLMSGAHLVQGILAALIRRNKKKTGALIEVNLLASLMDFQFEVLTTFLNDGGKLPERSARGNAHAYLSAPYGIYKTKDSYIVIAMGDLKHLGKVIGCNEILQYNKDEWFSKRDEIIAILSDLLKNKTTDEWLNILEPAQIWSAGVFDYERLINHESYQVLKMDQEINITTNKKITTTRCPIRIDGEKFFSSMPAPTLGKSTLAIDEEFELNIFPSALADGKK